jgi:CRP/FNR family transcriptional regulator, cyclic AMP receptor protein
MIFATRNFDNVSINSIMTEISDATMPKDIFDRLPFFQDLSPAQREALRPLLIACDCYGDTVLFQQGEAAEYLYLVVGGEVLISYKPEDGPPITVTRVGPGGVVGWSAALGNRLYTSSAACTVYTQMLRVRGEDLRSLCREDPDTGVIVLDHLASIIAERLRHTHDQVISLLKQGLISNV